MTCTMNALTSKL